MPPSKEVQGILAACITLPFRQSQMKGLGVQWRSDYWSHTPHDFMADYLERPGSFCALVFLQAQAEQFQSFGQGC